MDIPELSFLISCCVLQKFEAVLAASRSLLTSKKLRAVLEIILAFGNYMNSCNRGLAYGFKLQSLTSLADPKSADRRMSLLQFIVDTINKKMPEVANFDTELLFMGEAALVPPLDDLAKEILELEKGMEMTRKEFELRKDLKDDKPNAILKEFLNFSEERLRQLQNVAKAAREAFRECYYYFGESNETKPVDVFGVIDKFVKAYKVSLSVSSSLELRMNVMILRHLCRNMLMGR